MLTESEIKRFYEYVESLGFKFPVAVLTKATGFSKGQVSDYLSKKKDPSENFINAVYEKFPISSTNVPRGIYQSDISTAGNSPLSDLISSNNKLAQASLVQAEKDKIRAQADLVREEKEKALVESNAELTRMLRQATDGVDQYNALADPSIQSRLLEVLAELGEGKLWKTKAEGLVKLGNVLSVPEHVVKSRENTQSDVRKRSKV
jgi:hypothetical protein